jgi:hypothetical protein
MPLPGDSGFLLWLARQSLHGVVVYRDIWDSNPPLSHWILVPPAALIEAAGWRQQTAYNSYLLAWCLVALTLTGTLWRRWSAPPVPTPTTLIAAAIVLLGLPGPFIGQREHFMLAAAIPWIAAVAIWRSGEDVPAGPAIAAAAGVAIAIALKPFYLGWWIMAPALSRRALRSPAFWLVPAAGLVYLAAVSRTLFPAYAHEWAGLYWRYAHRPWWFVTVGNPFALLAVGATAITFRVARVTPLGTTLQASTVAAWVGAVAQGKALPYHYCPALMLSLLLLAYASRSTRRGVAAPVAGAWVAYTLYFLTVEVTRDRRAAASLEHAIGPSSVMVLSATADHGWLLTTEYDRPWLSTHYDLWWLAISGGGDSVPGLPHWREQDERLRRSLFIPRLPDVLLLNGSGVDVGDYLARSPAWRDTLAGYRSGASVAGYRLWRRAPRP